MLFYQGQNTRGLLLHLAQMFSNGSVGISMRLKRLQVAYHESYHAYTRSVPSMMFRDKGSCALLDLEHDFSNRLKRTTKHARFSN